MSIVHTQTPNHSTGVGIKYGILLYYTVNGMVFT